MQFVDLLQLVSGIVDLKEQSVLAAHIDTLDLRPLLEWIGVIVEVLKVQDGEYGVTGVVVEDDRRTREMLILDSPKAYILLPA
jgi:hypothetical protein